MDWNKFDKNILAPFEEKGDCAGNFASVVNAFTYTQIRLIALEAFKAGVASQQINTADEEGRAVLEGGDYIVNNVDAETISLTRR